MAVLEPPAQAAGVPAVTMPLTCGLTSSAALETTRAQKSITIIDGYIDESVLNRLTSKSVAVTVKILTKNVSASLETAAMAFNKQYRGLSIRTSAAFHDRFVIIDDDEFYHFGASLKDMGHRGFMFSRIEEETVIQALKGSPEREWRTATSHI